MIDNGDQAGREMHRLATELFPLHRSATGSGVRQTLDILKRWIPLDVVEVPSGTSVFDWEVPAEWNIHDAYIKDRQGQRVVDWRESTLHVVNGSRPVHETMPWSKLRNHIHCLPDHPDWIPYRTTFFRDNWGFCVSHRQFEQLDKQPEREFEVCIDATIANGSLTYGEVCVPGRSDDEILVSAHICHPSLANDNLSGIVVSTWLAKHLAEGETPRCSYRFLFAPATIGAIAWLARNQRGLGRIRNGLILSGVGDEGDLTYKQSRQGDALVDRAVSHLFAHGVRGTIRKFEPFGYDERQFCSPGIDMPMGCLMRTPCSEYAEYHTSADNLEFLKEKSLAATASFCLSLFNILESDDMPRNLRPYCEPRLGELGLYRAFGEQPANAELKRAVMWLLNLADGKHTLLDIAERADMRFSVIGQAAAALERYELLSFESDHLTTELIVDDLSGGHCPPYVSI